MVKTIQNGLFIAALTASTTFALGQEICSQNLEAGKIHGDSSSTTAPFLPGTIQNAATPSTNSPVEYLWIKTTDETTVNGATANFDLINNSNSATYTPTAIVQTTWYCRMVRYVGCSDYNAQTNWVRFTIAPNAVPLVIAPSQINAGEMASLAATGGIAYRWSNGATTANISVRPFKSTTYTVIIITENGDNVTLNKRIDVIRNVVAVNNTNSANDDDAATVQARNMMATEAQNAAPKAIITYPNPSSTDAVTIGFESVRTEKVTIAIMDLSGRMMQRDAIAATEGSNQYLKDLNNLPSGIYLIQIFSENQNFTPQRFVKL